MDTRQQNNRFAFYTAAVFFLLIMISAVSGVSSHIDNRWLDALVTHHANNNKPDSDIVVIDIDENSLQQLNNLVGAWPWPRSTHGTLLDVLSKQHPKAIVFDIFFTDPDPQRAGDDQAFIDSISKIDNVFFPVFEKTDPDTTDEKMIIDLPPTLNFVKGKHAQPDGKVALVMPNVIPSEWWKVGAVNETLDDDNIERRYNIYRTIAGWKLPTLPTRLASYFGFPIPPQQDFILDWQKSSAVAYPTFSYSQVLVNLMHDIDYPSKNYFTDKIIVVGSTAINAQTNHMTPISFEHPSAQVLATAIDNLKNGSFLYKPFGTFLNTFITLLLLIYMLVLFIKTKHRLSTITLGITILTVLLIAISYISVANKTLIPVANSLIWVWLYFLINMVWQYWRKIVSDYRVRTLFSGCVSTDTLHSLSTNNLIPVHAQQTNITILCCSIQHFSQFNQSVDAKTIATLLNDYFNQQVDIVFKYHGTLDNINGGTLLAFWGAPIPCEKHASLAVNTAMQMIEGVALFKKKHNLTTFDISIGIHTGMATVGMMGSTMQQHYTAIGHTIGVTKAIKSLVRDKSSVIISADTKAACADDFNFIDLGKHSLLSEKIELDLFEPKRK